MNTLFERTSSSWVRYSGYEWKEAEDGKLYLTPTRDAQPGIYDPLRDAQQLVLENHSENGRDFMILGSEVHIGIFDDRMEIYSPGGMMDGSLVRNLDTDQISSKRRNPVIADVFSRMNYMERRAKNVSWCKLKKDVPRAQP